MTLQMKIMIALAIMCVGLSVGVYYAFSLYQEEKTQREIVTMYANQAKKGLEDQLQQKADSMQLLATQVGVLNAEGEHWRKKASYYIGMAQRLQVIIDSLRDSGSASFSDGEDSIGTYQQVSFAGKKQFIAFEGYTRKYENKSSYALTMIPDMIDITSELFRDTDNIWKIRTESHTPGVKLKAYSIVDSLLFTSIISTPDPQKPVPIAGIIAEGAVYSTMDGVLTLVPAAEAYYKYYFVRYQPLQKYIYAGVRFSLISF